MIVNGAGSSDFGRQVAYGMGAEAYVLDRSIDSASSITTLSVERLLPEVDLVIGAVLVRGAKAPRSSRASRSG